MPLAALEALLDPESDAAARGLWVALDAAGLPSQAHHRGPTNAPHLTLVAAPRVDDGLVELTRTLLGPLLPCPVEVCGHVTFGVPPRVTLALLCTVPEALRAAVARLEAVVGGPRDGRAVGPRAGGIDLGRGWVPHLTLARRMTAAEVGRALDVLGREPASGPGSGSGARLTLTRVRRWDPVTRTVTPVVG